MTLTPTPRRVARRPPARPGENDAKLAQKLGQFQPSSCVPTVMYGPICICWANLTPVSLQGQHVFDFQRRQGYGEGHWAEYDGEWADGRRHGHGKQVQPILSTLQLYYRIRSCYCVYYTKVRTAPLPCTGYGAAAGRGGAAGRADAAGGRARPQPRPGRG